MLEFRPRNTRPNEKDAVSRIGGTPWRMKPEAGSNHVDVQKSTDTRNAPSHTTPSGGKENSPNAADDMTPSRTHGRSEANGGLAARALGAATAVDTEEGLSGALGDALETQAELQQRTDALEAQLQAEQLRLSLSAAVVENQRLKARLESMVESRQQLLGGIPLKIRTSDGTKFAPGTANAEGVGVPHRGSKSSINLLQNVSGVDPDTGAVEFRSGMTGRGLETGMPMRPLPSEGQGDVQDSGVGEDPRGASRSAGTRLDTAMVLTFGAVAASKLPPKRRPRPDPRLLDKLLNGVELPPPPRGTDTRVSGGHVADHWGPTAARGTVPPQFMDPAPGMTAHEVKDIGFKPPFERKR